MVIKRRSAQHVADELVEPADTQRADLGAMPKYRMPDHGADPDVAGVATDDLQADPPLTSATRPGFAH